MRTLTALSICLACITMPALANSENNDADSKYAAAQDNLKTSRFINAKTNPGISLQVNPGPGMAGEIANTFAPQFGVNANNLRTKKIKTTPNKGQVIRYQQQHQGIDVIGAEIVANVNSKNSLTSISGETSNKLNIDTQFQIPAIEAQATAISAVAKWYGLAEVELYVTTPVLKIYDPRLITPFQTGPELVWEMEVLPTDIRPLRLYILVNAIKGYITLKFNMLDTAIDLATYTANGTSTLPGTLLICDETDLTCAAGDNDAMNAHIYAADTYNFYFNNHGRDSIDDAGMTIISTVHYDDGTGFQNAGWNGTQMVYGDGFSVADDVVGHEITHGVTQYESNLIYIFQSGAINESFSDIWGEFIDQTNGKGTDTPAVKWLMGEDLPSIGAVRSMSDPTVFGDPDRMKSANYWPANNLGDNGGVHSNSGIGNKAAFLITDGGTFNGYTITGLGITKAAMIYYEAQTNLLTTGSDYNDLYNALNLACTNLNLAGTAGISAGDCAEVNKALLAVEMNQEPVTVPIPKASVCGSGDTINTIFYDDFESSVNPSWVMQSNVGGNQWTNSSQIIAKNGARAAFSDSPSIPTDSSIQMTTPVMIPAGTNTFVYFDHFFILEFNGSSYFDGGVVEYSADNGASWNDAGGFIYQGKNYTGTLQSGFSNPLAGRSAFSGLSYSYVSSGLALTPLAGENVLIRFRMGTDNSNAGFGWSIDNFRIYTCSQPSPQPPVANAGADFSVDSRTTANLSGSGTDPNGDPIFYSWVQTSGPSVTLNNANTATPSFTAPTGPATVIFRLDINDGNGGTDSDSVTVNINAIQDPPDDSGGCSVNTNANFDPIWLLLLSILIVVRQYRYYRCK